MSERIMHLPEQMVPGQNLFDQPPFKTYIQDLIQLPADEEKMYGVVMAENHRKIDFLREPNGVAMPLRCMRAAVYETIGEIMGDKYNGNLQEYLTKFTYQTDFVSKHRVRLTDKELVIPLTKGIVETFQRAPYSIQYVYGNTRHEGSNKGIKYTRDGSQSTAQAGKNINVYPQTYLQFLKNQYPDAYRDFVAEYAQSMQMVQ